MTADGSAMLRSIMDAAIQVLALSVGLVCVLIAGLVCYEIVGRTVFASSIVWVEEVVSYLVAYATFVGAAVGLCNDGHVRVDFLVSRPHGPGLFIVRLVVECIAAIGLALVAYLAIVFWTDAFETGERSPTLLGIQLWIPYLSFMGGMVLLFLVQLGRLWHLCMSRLGRAGTRATGVVNGAAS